MRFIPKLGTLQINNNACLAHENSLPTFPCYKRSYLNSSSLRLQLRPSPKLSTIESEEEDKYILLLQHHQYLDDIFSVARDNSINNELKMIHCAAVQVRRQTTLNLAIQNEIEAAQALNLPQCQRIKPIANSLLIQQCKMLISPVYPRATECGFEPLIRENKTIGTDGFSLTHALDCFWPSNMANLNGVIRSWNG